MASLLISARPDDCASLCRRLVNIALPQVTAGAAVAIGDELRTVLTELQLPQYLDGVDALGLENVSRSWCSASESFARAALVLARRSLQRLTQ